MIWSPALARRDGLQRLSCTYRAGCSSLVSPARWPGRAAGTGARRNAAGCTTARGRAGEPSPRAARDRARGAWFDFRGKHLHHTYSIRFQHRIWTKNDSLVSMTGHVDSLFWTVNTLKSNVASGPGFISRTDPKLFLNQAENNFS